MPVDVLGRHAVRDPVVDEALWIAVAPGAQALLVVGSSLQHRRARDGRDVRRASDVVGVHVRDDDALERRVQLVEHRLPALRRLARRRGRCRRASSRRRCAGGSSGRGRGRTAAGRSRDGSLPLRRPLVRSYRLAMAPLLELNDVSARYGQVAALHGVSLTVDEGEIVALLGANGAGKTTTLRAVSGMVRRSGEVIVGGKRLRGAGPESVARVRRRARARGARHLLRADGLGEPAHGRVHAARPSGLQDRARLLPLARRAPQPAGGHALGRRAADARARTCVPAAAAAA